MKKIIKSICFSLLAFMFAIGSIFLPIGSKNNNQYASADVTIQGDTNFISSNILYATVGFRSSADYYQGFDQFLYSNAGLSYFYNNYFNFSFRLSYNIYGAVNFYYIGYFDPSGMYIGSNATDWNLLTSLYPSQLLESSDSWTFVKQNAHLYNTNLSSISGQTILACQIYRPDTVSRDTVPSLNMVSVELSPSETFEENTGLDIIPSTITNAFIVSYVDTTGFRYSFAVPNLYSYPAGSYLSYRKYFLAGALDFSNNDYYNQGLTEGYSQGYDGGYNVGYREGSSIGYENGYDNGLIEGAINSNNYSFFGLISAVIDAPVKILTSLFNFEFLGVNLWAFFTSILTISLVIFVIRKFMAKG